MRALPKTATRVTELVQQRSGQRHVTFLLLKMYGCKDGARPSTSDNWQCPDKAMKQHVCLPVYPSRRMKWTWIAKHAQVSLVLSDISIYIFLEEKRDTATYIYIYIHIERERERKKNQLPASHALEQSKAKRERERERERELLASHPPEQSKAKRERERENCLPPMP